MAQSLVRTALILGLLAAVGPFAIDMYLPALPEIARDLNTSVTATQATLTLYFAAFGISQLIYGPWADQVGRKLPLYVGLGIFVIGSIGSMLAPTIGWLIAARFVQGAGGAVVMVVPRAIIRDLHTGNEATRLMAMIMLVISVSPMLAPLAGSVLILAFDWRAVFLAMALSGVVSLFVTRVQLDETHPPAKRVAINPGNLFRGAMTLFKSRSFMALTMIGAFGFASFFVFIASASFVYTGQYGLSAFGFSVAFAINAIGFFGGSQLAAPIGMRIGAGRTVSLATTGFAIMTILLLGVTLAGWLSFPLLVGMLFLANVCLGLVIPTTMVLALDDHGDIAGLASSLGGTLQMLVGGAVTTLAGPFFNGTATPMVGAIAVCGALAFTISRFALSARAAKRSPAT